MTSYQRRLKEIREIFVDNLKAFIDDTLYNHFIKESYIRMKALEAIKDRVDDALQAAVDQLRDDIEMDDFDIHEYGKRGRSSLDLDDICRSDHDEEISRIVNENL